MGNSLLKYTLLVSASIFVICSCSVMNTYHNHKKTQILRTDTITAKIQLPKEKEIDFERDPSYYENKHKNDTLTVIDPDGHRVHLMATIKDENGEMVANETLEAAIVTARFRNVAERHGKVDIEFQVIVPKQMQDSRWQLRFYPDMYVMGDSVRLDPVIITGNDYRKAQLKGYQHYEKFLASIVNDSTVFINLWQLELYISRHMPGLYAFKNDSTYVSDEQFASYYGVTEKEAIEHYTNKYAKARNEKRKRMRHKKYAKYVKTPIVTEGIRLDTVIKNYNGDFVYNYVQTINTRPKLRKVDVVLSGDIWDQDKKVYNIPRSEPLTFYISSLSTFVDSKERYLKKVIYRKAEAQTACYVDFAVGKSDVNLELSNNRSELGRVKKTLASLMEDTVFDLDSMAVAANASPEGSKVMNDRLSEKRAESISKYLNDYIRHYQDSLIADRGFSIDENGVIHKEQRRKITFKSRSNGENWRMLDNLVRSDTVMTDKQKEDYFALETMRDIDARERSMQALGCYKYMRESLYPRLRTVSMTLSLSRKGMVKDTVQTTVLDSVYMSGVQAIRDRDFEKAVSLLRPYKDFNTAIAYLAMDYNASALDILKRLDQTDQVNYMLAIIYSRMGDNQNAVQHYMTACKQNGMYVHRGNLDPEISVLIKTYGLNKEEDPQF